MSLCSCWSVTTASRLAASEAVNLPINVTASASDLHITQDIINELASYLDWQDTKSFGQVSRICRRSTQPTIFRAIALRLTDLEIAETSLRNPVHFIGEQPRVGACLRILVLSGHSVIQPTVCDLDTIAAVLVHLPALENLSILYARWRTAAISDQHALPPIYLKQLRLVFVEAATEHTRDRTASNMA